MTGKLFTYGGGFVADFEMPPFSFPPEVAVWGSRIFVLRRRAAGERRTGGALEYDEACAWSVDVSKMLESTHGGETT